MRSYCHAESFFFYIAIYSGLETTVTTLRWGFLYMLHHPEVQEKCRQEIQAVLANRDEKVLQYRDRIDTPYVVATLNEIQRCSNILPLAAQLSNLEDTEVGGL